VSIKTGFSKKNLPDAVTELKQHCGSCEPLAVLCFASSAYDQPEISRQLSAAFPRACVMGCSTAGEISSGAMMTGSVVSMFLGSDTLESACCAVVPDLRNEISIRGAFSKLESYFGTPVSAMDPNQYLGLILVDGLSGAEERLMEKIGDYTDLNFVGGSAGDDLKFQKTHVFCNGQAYTNAAMLALLRVKKGFEILKTQSFQPTDSILVATEVDEGARTVLQFNHKPALNAYAEALAVSPEQAPTLFMQHPLGLMIGGDPFVRSPQRTDGQSIVFYCNIKEGMELRVLTGGDIVAETRAVVEARKRALEGISGLIDFHCILRTLELRSENRCHQYGSIFRDIPTIGFSTYGEEYLGHINQTSTMLLFH
jgi:hypothetical protein